MLLCNFSRAQDTVSVFFETGKYDAKGLQLVRLDHLHYQYDFSALDSVAITGMADSVGNLRNNLKLSLLRAKNVSNYIKDYLPKKIRISMYAAGEKISFGDRQQSRRVDLIFYFKNLPAEENNLAESEITKDSLRKCYQVAYLLLHRSNRRILTRGRRKFVQIQIENYWLAEKKNYYYASETSGKWVVRKVRWITRATGLKWWEKQRETALIPFNDYKKFRIFTLSDSCSDCSGIFPSDQPVNDETTCMQTDRFLMHNLQLKYSLFPKKLILVRAPREFIDPEASYYAGCELYPFKWFTKKGRSKRNYYYAGIPRGGAFLANIIKETECCEFKSEDSDCKRPFIGIIDGAIYPQPLSIGMEAGYDHFLQTDLFYAGVTLHKYGRSWQSALLLGGDQLKEFYSSLRLQKNIITIPAFLLDPSNAWRSPGKYSMPNNFLRLYLGSELIQRWGESYQQLQQNVHAGISFYNQDERNIFRRAFVQAGYAHCWSDGKLPAFFFTLQAGIHLKIANIGSPPLITVDEPY